MRKLMSLLICSVLMLLSVASASAQSAPERMDISVNVTCGSLTVTLTSDYSEAVKAQVYAGSTGPTEWNLVNKIGEFTRAAANGTGSRTYTYANQPANTTVYYSVRVYNDVNNGLVDFTNGAVDCDGNANNQPATSTTTTTTTTPTTQTASFLAACDLTGGITVQPIAGIPFTITSTQIAQGTAMAIANNQNITIQTASGITAFGTPANAVQFVASDGYTLTIPASSCTQTVTTTTVTTTVTSASAQAAQLSCDNVPADAVRTHVVSAGENLFRIGLRYGVPFTRLAVYNGIPDATRIFVGQCIGIPAA